MIEPAMMHDVLLGWKIVQGECGTNSAIVLIAVQCTTASRDER
jgi:hypothetical protein